MNKEQEYMVDILIRLVSYINFDNKESSGLLEIHQDVKGEVIKIFKEIIELSIFKIETIDNYDDDEKSVVANNSSGYNFRFVRGTKNEVTIQ
jgi:hypothetical protein